jgi:putative hydrolase of the HAD superfamily
MKFQAVLFDAGNTLVFIDPEVVLPIFRTHGAVLRPETFWEAEFEARTALAERVLQGATGTEPELWHRYFVDLFRGCGVPENRLDRLGKVIRDVHRERHLWTHIDPRTRPALRRLRNAGYRLAVISNADGRIRQVMEEVGLTEFLEFVIDSEEEGVEKPHPRIFHLACDRLEVEPQACLYVGDLYPVDVLGARAAGLEAVLLDPLDRLDYPVDRIQDVAALPAFLRRLSPSP